MNDRQSATDRSGQPIINQTVLITGASAGIGAQLARLYAARHANLILVARDRQRLVKLADELQSQNDCRVAVVEQDLAQPGGAAALVERVQRDCWPVDLLINNAGAGHSGLLIDSESQTNTALLELNIGALTELSRAFARQMVTRGAGQILNVASTGAYQPGPYTAVYYAAKSYVHSFSLALAEELRGTGVSVSLLCPGATATEFSSRAGKADLKLAMSANWVARTAVWGLDRHQRLIIPGFGNRLTILFSKLLPGHVLAAIVRRIQEPLVQPR